jgi:DNA-binding response OmpR family regulator
MANPGVTTAPRATILLVEDDADIRESVAEFLEEEGFSAVTAANGKEAEAYLLKNPAPACLVLDLMMPLLDGWTLAGLMREGHLPQIPIVVMTAADSHWGYPTPPGQVLRKPVNALKLLRLVRALASPTDLVP